METDRLLLRPFEPRDLDALHAIHGDERNVRWLYHEVRSLEETRELLALKAGGSSLRTEGEWLSAAVILRATGELVGDVSLLWASEAHRQGELGFVLHPAQHGRGYATEAARAMLAFAFEGLGIAPRGWAARAAEHRLGARPREARDAPRGASCRERMGEGRVAERARLRDPRARMAGSLRWHEAGRRPILTPSHTTEV